MNDSNYSAGTVPATADALRSRWRFLSQHATGSQYGAHPVLIAGLPKRAIDVLQTNGIQSVLELLTLDPDSLSKQQNIGLGTMKALLSAAEQVLRLEELRTSESCPTEPPGTDAKDPSIPGDSSLSARWYRLRALADSFGEPIPLRVDGLSVRAERLVLQLNVKTVQELAALEPEQLLRHSNVGRRTLTGLLVHLNEYLKLLADDSQPPSFTEMVDVVVAELPERSRQIAAGRLRDGLRLAEVAAATGVTRERVRQIERQFIRRVSRATWRTDVRLEAVLEDGVIDIAELTDDHYQPLLTPSFYVTVARALSTRDGSFADVERFYASQLRIIADEIRNDDEYVIGQLRVETVAELSMQLAPALRELCETDPLDRLQTILKAGAVNGRLIGRKPQVGRIIRALLRRADGPIRIELLLNQLAVALAAYGEVSYFDQILLRNKLVSMPGIQMVDEHTASGEATDKAAVGHWIDKVVRAIEKAGKPASIVRFLDENEDAPFDAFGLASLLKNDPRVIHIGRRLYVHAAYEAEGPVRIAALIDEALHKAGRPMTRRQLLGYVREKRDLKCAQVENYFSRVSGLVSYTNDIVGLVAMDRSVMIDMLCDEGCILSLLRERHDDGPVSVTDIWLDMNTESELTAEEENRILKSARKWDIAVVESTSSGLFFGIRED